MINVKTGVTILKFLLMATGVLFLIHNAYGFWIACPQREQTRNLRYRVERIKKGNMENTVSCTGTLSAVGTVDVGTQVSGTIRQVLVDYNDQVKKGQILAKLEPDLFHADLNTAKASVIRATAIFKQAQAEYKRHTPLYEQGHLSAEEILEYETQVETARADLLSAKAAVAGAVTNLKNAQIKAPINGIILERGIDAGQTVAASYSTPTLFIIAEDLSNMEIEAGVDESDIGLIKKGQPVRFTVQSYPDTCFYGTVKMIRLNPEEESDVVTYTVVVDAPNKDGKLMPGMTATADFIVETAQNVLMVPNTALIFRPDGPVRGSINEPGIYTLEGGIPERIPVTTGISTSTATQIKNNDLAVGIPVITGRLSEKTENSGGILSRIFPRSPGGRGPRPGM